MKPYSRFLFPLPALVAFALMFAPAAAQESDEETTDTDATPETSSGRTATPAALPPAPVIQRENLVNNSPFRIRVPRRDTTTVSQVLEIRGFMGSGRNLEVSLSNPNTLECQWVRVGDPDARWFVESADPVTRTANVRMDGVVIPVSMVKPVELPPPAPPPIPTISGVGVGPVAGPPPGGIQRPNTAIPTSTPAPASPAVPGARPGGGAGDPATRPTGIRPRNFVR